MPEQRLIQAALGAPHGVKAAVLHQQIISRGFAGNLFVAEFADSAVVSPYGFAVKFFMDACAHAAVVSPWF